MCRLFGMHAGQTPLPATFWLLDAPDSLSAQSHRNPDGAGIGVFAADGRPRVDKQPIAAWADSEFASAARDLVGTTFVAHVRYASTGNHTRANTHPFRQEDRLCAHNGVVHGLTALEDRLEELGARGLARGETDSERVFALITAETMRHDGDVGRGLVAAVEWVADQLPVFALNLVLTTATDLWALRYPETHELWVLDRPAGGTGAARHLDARTDRIRAHSDALAGRRSVIVASERMDDDAGWRLMDAGELLHVGPDLAIDTSAPFRAEPQHLLTVADLDAVAAASQLSGAVRVRRA